ncbi:glutamate--cysteine ligase [Streptomyces sp. NPDC005017]|uniref:carboxylate-amine ligase n=1 Tax=Streptomyces sp. NPDC005017 TaxID=3364706 RepID=UPI003693DFAE
MTTIGVEEEYMLVHPVTGLPVPYAEKVRKAAGLERLTGGQEVQGELLQSQVEVATPVCHSLDEVGGHLLRLRHALASAAETHGCRIAAAGTPALRDTLHAVPVTDHARYRAMAAQAPQLVAEQLVNGMHVHVAVPSRDAGVQVLNRLRLWLPTLTAMAANSPLWDGRDTGFASWRTVVFSRWTVAGLPPVFEDSDDYDQRVQHLVDCGLVADRGQLYWLARLSERYPTVEVRCTDVQLLADDAVMLAGVVRALVQTALAEASAGAPVPDCAPELLQASLWHAARYGLSGSLMDPGGAARRAGDVLWELFRHTAAALEESGDTREVSALVHRLLRRGTGADRQRAAFAAGGPLAAVELVVRESSP